VISVGGYAAAPAVLAGAVLRIPIALVNTDALPGRTNILAARFARRIFVGFESAKAAFPSRSNSDRVQCLGIPLRRALVDAFAATPPRRRPEAPFRVLVFGGSQGARQLNDAMVEAARAFAPDAIEVFHQTGEADRDRISAAYAAAHVRAEVVAFEPAMPQRYRWADIALCRAGALTVAELALAGLPALLVPYPFAAHDEQSANARALVAANAAIHLDPKTLRAEDVTHALKTLFAAPDRLVAMSAAATTLARPDAADRIAEACLEMIER
jgi:UDP-N-acetylglucosamine--N-acetylmuramyl-(pentapeptide) pyrophosphoryl-undecaprenol N-acetylglucosamine transferase